MKPADRAAQKLTSVTALLVLAFGLVLAGKFCVSTQADADVYTLFSDSLKLLLGYYIGRYRYQQVANGNTVETDEPPAPKPPAPPAEPPKGA